MKHDIKYNKQTGEILPPNRPLRGHVPNDEKIIIGSPDIKIVRDKPIRKKKVSHHRPHNPYN